MARAAKAQGRINGLLLLICYVKGEPPAWPYEFSPSPIDAGGLGIGEVAFSDLRRCLC